MCHNSFIFNLPLEVIYILSSFVMAKKNISPGVCSPKLTPSTPPLQGRRADSTGALRLPAGREDDEGQVRQDSQSHT